MENKVDQDSVSALSQNAAKIILKKVKDISKALEDDLIFARRTEEAFKRYEKGKFTEMDFDEFMQEAKTW